MNLHLRTSLFKFLFCFFLIFVSHVLLLSSPSAAEESPISVIESWVEDGYEFHVGLEAPSSNTECPLQGEGLIEFEVAYHTSESSEPDSVFGVAIWYPGQEEEKTATYGKAIGPQAFCTKFSPCRIQAIRVVEAWCPPAEGPLYSW